jgi:hypothetical protein
VVLGAGASVDASGQATASPGLSPERCATRLSIAFVGEASDPALLQSKDRQATIEALLADPRFHERFARFLNARLNPDPGETSADDAVYHLAKHVLANKLPWKELFIGPYQVAAADRSGQQARVQNDPNGLGYFRSPAWLERYAGNEETGVRLATAYRLLNNVVGLELNAVTNAPDADISATGRQAPACAGCHYDGWYALDKTAEVLGRAVRGRRGISFTPPDGLPKPVLGGLMLRDDKELVTALVDSEQFVFNACRVVFAFLYGRNENACEAELFDRCVDAIKSSGLLQSALATVATDPSFCQ